MGHTRQGGRRRALRAAGLALAIGLAACDGPLGEPGSPGVETPVAEAAGEVAVDAAAEVEPAAPAANEDPVAATPPAAPAAADSVQPESETLFY